MARLPQPGGDSGNWGDILNDYLRQAHKTDGSLQDDTVTSSVIQDGAITNSKVADSALAKSKLDSEVQTSLAKADSALQSIADSSITSAKIVDDAITTAKLAPTVRAQLSNLATDPNASYASVRLEQDQWVPLGYRARPPYNSTGNAVPTIQSNGTNLGGSFRMIEQAQLSGKDLCIEFALYLNNAGEAENGSDVTITRAAISLTNATNIPFTFNGDTSVTVKGSKYGTFKVRSDPLGMNITKGQTYSIIVNVSVASGVKYPLSIIARRGNFDEGSSGDITIAGPAPDATGFGTSWTNTPGSIRMFMCSAVLTRPAVPSRVALFIGDSISVGTGESIAPSNARWDEGWCTRSVRDKYPHYVIGLSGTTLERWYDAPQNNFRRRSVMAGIYYTDIICELGVNDFQGGASVATVQSRWLTVWRDLARSGRRVWQSTITPAVISSTDLFTTVNGQTANAVAPIVAAGNDWLRDGAPIDTATGLAVAVGTTGGTIARAPNYYTTNVGIAAQTTFTGISGHPLAGILEVADAIETARNSGVVKALPGARVVTDGAITSGAVTLTSATATFAASDVGRLVRISGAGISGSALLTSISAYTSSTTVTVAAAASTTVTGVQVLISPYGMMADGVHPSGTAGPDPGGHETIANFVRPQLALILGTESV